jgi:PAS domain-containing protein
MAMSNQLPRLLKSYEFLRSGRNIHGGKLPPGDAKGLDGSIDRLFLDILTHVSDDPRVTMAQVRFLLTSMADLIPDAEKHEALGAACQRHLNRLDVHFAPRPVNPPIAAPLQYRYLDSMRDRVAVVDAAYRYVYTNKANADFHGSDTSSFIGRPNWQVIGQRYFELFNKPRFDACFAGQSDSYIAAHPLRDPSKLHAVNVDPVLDDTGQITSILVICRDVSGLRVPAELITPMP